MRISHKHKFIFIATPKTGCTSIMHLLNEFSDIKSKCGEMPRHHTTYAEALKHFDFAKDYTSFAFARNPWDRCVSNWYYMQRVKTGKGNFSEKCKNILKKYSSFKDYIMDGSMHTRFPCFNWLSSDGVHVDIDYACKMENIQEDFDAVCDKIGIPRQTVPHKNVTTHKHYTEYYDDETRQIIAQKYAQDIEYFGYKFGE